MKLSPIVLWALRLIAAFIMLQTLYFKFTGHEQSVRLFTQLGMEPWGRIGTGVFELIASILILFPRTTGYGAALGLGLMSGAIFFHLTKIGIMFDGDYLLFTYAVIAFISCLILAIHYRQQLFRLLKLNSKPVTRLLILILIICVVAPTAASQTTNSSRVSQYVDLTGTVGESQGSVAGSFVHNWKLGSRKRFEIGIGGRWTSYFGSKKDFITSGPAKYTRSYTVPFLIFFAGQEEQNFDTLTLQRPLTHSINAMINLGFSFSPKWYAGCNIDVIGFSFGRKTSGIFTSNGVTITDPAAKPSSFNLLLTGDHDKGTLNSEFYLRYRIAERWSVKALYQFLFVEYQSQLISQTFPDGEMNDRFRNKANNLGLGVSYFFK